MNMASSFRTRVRMAVAIVAITCIGAARAESGDGEAVAKARRDYEAAKRSGDIGLINAMKITLDVQRAKARARAEKKARQPAMLAPITRR